MQNNPQNRERRSIRLKGWEYFRPAWYYATICTHNRECLLGKVERDEMWLSRIGEITREEWLQPPVIRPALALDEWVIMPNHLHGIIILCEDQIHDHTVGANGDSPQRATPFRSPSKTIGAIVRGFKSAATKMCQRISKDARHADLAAQLLRAHRSRRRRSLPHPNVHPRQSSEMGGRRGESEERPLI